MSEGYSTLLGILRWVSSALFIYGLLLLLLSPGAYNDLEKILGKEIGGIRKRVTTILENNFDFLHKWMLSKKNIVGLLFIAISLALLFLVR